MSTSIFTKQEIKDEIVDEDIKPLQITGSNLFFQQVFVMFEMLNSNV